MIGFIFLQLLFIGDKKCNGHTGYGIVKSWHMRIFSTISRHRMDDEGNDTYGKMPIPGPLQSRFTHAINIQ